MNLEITILEWLNTPADLYAMAVECRAAWQEGYEDAIAARKKGEELRGGAQATQPRAITPRSPRTPARRR